MKFTIHASPQFDLDITSDQLTMLAELAALHYDAACKSAAEVGGFIYGWIIERRWVGRSDPTDMSMTATWRQLDLCLKIMENPPRGYSRMDAVRQLRRLIFACMGAWEGRRPKAIEGEA